MKKKVIVGIAFLILLFFLPVTTLYAQDIDPPVYPTYIIQPGDTLATIAYQFGLSLDELIRVNNIENPNAIPIGAEIILPGMEGISGVLTTILVQLGDTLDSLSVKYRVPKKDLIRINKLSSSSELYENANMILPIHEEEQAYAVGGQNNGDRTLLEMAVLNDQNAWELNIANLKSNTWDYQTLEPIFVHSDANPGQLIAAEVSSITIEPGQIMQGDIAIIKVYSNAPLPNLTGTLSKNTLHFFEEEPNVYIAYQGIHAQLEPGLHPFSISASDGENKLFVLEQMIHIGNSLYPFESLFVAPETIDSATMDAEQAIILDLTSTANSEKYFNETFTCVVDQPVCIRSWFGTNRNYNDGIYYNFHSGIDYGICATLNVYAPADGFVVYTDLLTVRGNTTYIDHGRGIYSGFFHQDQILVQEGDFVEAGQLIGYMGATGRVTGTHLHYEIIVNGVHVNPLQWLDTICQ